VECQEVAPTLRSVRDRKAGSARTAESVYHIDDTNGNDTRSDLEAQDPATPWKTIGRGIQATVAGDTVIVQPGDYYESVESIRDGLPDAPIIIQAAFLGTVMIQPPVDSVGINIQHHYHIVDGLVVTGGTQGIKMAPHHREDWIVGVVAQNNEV
jgi:parallel beta-helix repeat protein